MADVVLSYARENRDRVRVLRDRLLREFDVWWDEDITVGDYRAEIEAQLTRAKCVVPVWSAASRNSAQVVDEVQIAVDADVPVLPVRIERVPPPLGFGRLHMIELDSWDGSADDENFLSLLERIRRLCRNAKVARPERIKIGMKDIAVPAFVFSVSSHETQIVPAAAAAALAIWKPAALLVSAYDLADSSKRQKLHAAIDRCTEGGSVVLLDSGNYEASRKGDGAWRADPYHRVLAEVSYDAAFHFDNIHPPSDWRDATTDIIESVKRDQGRTKAPVIPILHIPQRARSQPYADRLADMAVKVAAELRPQLIAVPERELGAGLVERARTVHVLRSALDRLGFYQPLHLLGTGNHFSAAVFAAAGADCFDGLEWCRTIADHQTGGLYHFQHYDLFSWQDGTSESDLVREIGKDHSLPFEARAAFHNLDFFDRWMADLREAIWTGKADRFLTAKLPGGMRTVEQLEEELPGVLS